jgi:hypothetical protein
MKGFPSMAWESPPSLLDESKSSIDLSVTDGSEVRRASFLSVMCKHYTPTAHMGRPIFFCYITVTAAQKITVIFDAGGDYHPPKLKPRFAHCRGFLFGSVFQLLGA